MKKRLLSTALVLSMLLSMLPTIAFAAEQAITGTEGDVVLGTATGWESIGISKITDTANGIEVTVTPVLKTDGTQNTGWTYAVGTSKYFSDELTTGAYNTQPVTVDGANTFAKIGSDDGSTGIIAPAAFSFEVPKAVYETSGVKLAIYFLGDVDSTVHMLDFPAINKSGRIPAANSLAVTVADMPTDLVYTGLAQTAESVITITNDGTNEQTNVTAALSGRDAASFVIDGINSITSIAAGADDATLSVKLKSAVVDAGTYEANVTVTSAEGVSKVVPVSVTIGKKPLTVTGTVTNKAYDTTTDADVVLTVTGAISPDVITATSTDAVFADANVGLAKAVTGTFTLAATTGKVANYKVTSTALPTLIGEITAVTVGVTGGTVTDKVFDGTTAATVTGLTVTGAINPDVITATAPDAVFADANVGTNKAVTGTVTLGGAAKDNYTAPAALPALTGKITAKPVTLKPVVKQSIAVGGAGVDLDDLVGFTDGNIVAGFPFAGTWTYAVDATNAAGAAIAADGVVTTTKDGNSTVTATFTPDPTVLTPNYSLAVKTVDIEVESNANDQATISYDGNGATSGTMVNELVAFDTDKKLTKNTFVKTGYEFAGWKIDGGDDTIIANEATIPVVKADIKLIAQWTANQVEATKPAIPAVEYGTNGTIPAPTVTMGGDGTDAATGTKSYAITSTHTELVDGLVIDTATGIITLTPKNITTITGLKVTVTAANGSKAEVAYDDITIDPKEVELDTSAVTVKTRQYDETDVATLENLVLLNSPILAGDVDTVKITATGAKFDNANVGTNKPVTVGTFALEGANAGNYELLEPDFTLVTLEGEITEKEVTPAPKDASINKGTKILMSYLVNENSGIEGGAYGTMEVKNGVAVGGVTITFYKENAAKTAWEPTGELPTQPGKYYFTMGAAEVVQDNFKFMAVATPAVPTHPATTGFNELVIRVPSSDDEPLPAPLYQVQFEAGKNGKISDIGKQGVREGGSVTTVPTATADNGFKFVGWSVDGGNTMVDPLKHAVTKATTFTAIFTDSSEHTLYIKGREYGDFAPHALLERGEVAAMLARLSSDYAIDKTYGHSFTDLDSSIWYYQPVTFLASKGIATGYQDNTYKPYEKITRAEFVAMVGRFLNIEATGTSQFADVNGHWAEGYITALTKLGAIDGYKDGSFKPDAKIERADAVKILNVALGRTPDKAKVDEAIAAGVKNPFADVDSTFWAFYHIMEAGLTHMPADFHN